MVEADLEEPDTLDGAFAGGERPVAAYAAVAAGSFDELECNLCGAQRGVGHVVRISALKADMTLRPEMGAWAGPTAAPGTVGGP